MGITKSKLRKIIKEELVKEAFDSSSNVAQGFEDAYVKLIDNSKRRLAAALLFNEGPDKTARLVETLNKILAAANSTSSIASIELA